MKRFLLLILFSLTYFLGFSQIININNSADAESSYSLQTLIEDVLISGTCAQINTFTEQVSGLPIDNQNKSYGFFKRPTGSNFPFEAGVVLSTGKAYSGGNVTNGDLVSNDVGLSGDLDLQSALSITNTNDATYIKFNFIPATNTISFKFIMASEEYDGGMECSYADSFAFLLREVGTTNYINMAVLPDGTPVSVTN
ncbi:MAG TPA: gliding motility-associated C-terminal domain-containing protein, partial [Flavobacteriaceae bacterium]|nr:gliding motility-associated C-terminal domain-containing protein [Flavobacteriaceae bacterium]